MIRKVIVPAAGLGTRLRALPATKVQSKEMLPTFSHTATGGVVVKPMVRLFLSSCMMLGFESSVVLLMGKACHWGPFYS